MESEHPLAIPLAGQADRDLAVLFDAARPPRLDGATILGERAHLMGFKIPGRSSAGGGCRLYNTRDGWVALNLARPDDRALLPALFQDLDVDANSDNAVAKRMAAGESRAIVERGREMGLAIAGMGEPALSQDRPRLVTGASRAPPRRPPLVVDLSALWAGPLAGHLLWLAGAEVLKLESRSRADAMRAGEPDFFALLNQGKASAVLDFSSPQDRAALIALLHMADIVIEAARPRALAQLGIVAEAIVAQTPGQVWVAITGHGAGEGSNWAGFGDDCGVAAGLSDALHEASGAVGFVGDAIADPLAGISAARLAWEQWTSGQGARVHVSMRDATAEALKAERETAPARLHQDLRRWAASEGKPFPPVQHRPFQLARPLGADTRAWVARARPC